MGQPSLVWVILSSLTPDIRGNYTKRPFYTLCMYIWNTPCGYFYTLVYNVYVAIEAGPLDLCD